MSTIATKQQIRRRVEALETTAPQVLDDITYRLLAGGLQQRTIEMGVKPRAGHGSVSIEDTMRWIESVMKLEP